jgi:hypothetical protein
MNSDEIREIAHDHRGEWAGRVAAALREIDGVAAADVAAADVADVAADAAGELGADGDGLIARVRLVDGADAQQVVAAAEQLLRDRFGLGLAPGGVEVVADAPAARPGTPKEFRLDHVEIVGHGDRRVAVVAVSLVDAVGVHPVSGSAIVAADDQRAVAEAVLDAVYRASR